MRPAARLARRRVRNRTGCDGQRQADNRRQQPLPSEPKQGHSLGRRDAGLQGDNTMFSAGERHRRESIDQEDVSSRMRHTSDNVAQKLHFLLSVMVTGTDVLRRNRQRRRIDMARSSDDAPSFHIRLLGRWLLLYEEQLCMTAGPLWCWSSDLVL